MNPYNPSPGQPPSVPENPPVRRSKPLPENKPSLLLSRDENQSIFDILGKGRQTLSTAVAQLLVPTPDQGRWHVRETGVLCLVRDTTKKSYFIQVFSLRTKSMVFRQEIYSQFDYLMPQAWFLTFEGDTSMVGINFADRVEAVNFKEALDNKLESKRHRKNERRSRIFDQQAPHKPPPAQPYPSQPSIISNGTSALPMGFNFSAKGRFSSKKEKKKDKGKGGKGLLRKEDIGTPTDFRHVQHVGWDPNRGFDLDGVDSNFQAFFQKAGVSRSQLEDEGTREFIYNFIDQYQANEEAVAPTPPPHRPPPPPMALNNNSIPGPPPVPIRHSPLLHHSGVGCKAPPPPPPSRGIPPSLKGPAVPNRNSPESRTESSPPSMIPPPPLPGMVQAEASMSRSVAPKLGAGGPPPPPPPPPMPMEVAPDTTDLAEVKEKRAPANVPVVDDTRSDLMKQIQSAQRGNLKKVEPNAAPKKSGGLSDCLSEIRSGAVHLKKPEEVDRILKSPETMEGLAGALARALAERSRAINPESSGSEDNEDFESDDEWDE